MIPKCTQFFRIPINVLLMQLVKTLSLLCKQGSPVPNGSNNQARMEFHQNMKEDQDGSCSSSSSSCASGSIGMKRKLITSNLFASPVLIQEEIPKNISTYYFKYSDTEGRELTHHPENKDLNGFTADQKHVTEQDNSSRKIISSEMADRLKKEHQHKTRVRLDFGQSDSSVKSLSFSSLDLDVEQDSVSCSTDGAPLVVTMEARPESPIDCSTTTMDSTTVCVAPGINHHSSDNDEIKQLVDGAERLVSSSRLHHRSMVDLVESSFPISGVGHEMIEEDCSEGGATGMKQMVRLRRSSLVHQKSEAVLVSNGHHHRGRSNGGAKKEVSKMKKSLSTNGRLGADECESGNKGNGGGVSMMMISGEKTRKKKSARVRQWIRAHNQGEERIVNEKVRKRMSRFFWWGFVSLFVRV